MIDYDNNAPKENRSRDKKEIERIILNYLLKNPCTQCQYIINELNGSNRRDYKRLSNEEAMLMNDVIFDFIVKRIITPGMNASNLEWPFLHVSNIDKLNEELESLK